MQGNYDRDDNYGKFRAADGAYSIKEASITIYEGTIIVEGIKEENGLKLEDLTLEQAIGAVAERELVHATDKK